MTNAPGRPPAQPPPAGEPRLYRFPAFRRTILGNGLQVITCDLPRRPLAAARLILEAGASYEPAEQAGVAALAARTVTEGTRRRDSAAFADAVERLGAEVDVDASWDSFQARLTVPMSRIEDALALLAEAIREPSFPGREVERLRDERLNEISQERADPGHRAHLALLEAVYASDSIYSRPSAGTAETVAVLDRDAVEHFYARFAAPATATLIVAGDLGEAFVEETAERLFGDWSVPEPDRPARRAEDAVAETTVTLVNRPGSVQSQIALGHTGVPMVTPDHHAVTAMVTVFGGLFTSRLNLKLREEKGYTYGVRASFDFRRDAGPFLIRSAVHTEVTVPAIADTFEELWRIHFGGVEEHELAEAKDYLIGVVPLAFETPSAIADAIGRLVVYGLADDYYDSYRPAMAAVTREEASEAAGTRLRPDRTAVVVVGDGAVIEGPLRDAGIGPVKVVEDAPPGHPQSRA